jgi:hypothetical protein
VAVASFYCIKAYRMPFSIAFQEEPLLYPCEDRTTPAAGGVLVLGNTNEHFIASLYHWSKEDWPMYLAGTRFSSKISSFSVTSCREHFRSRMHFHSCATAKQKTRQEGRFLSGA